jgi:Fungal Zn(2)-Cys(6) binuclear cluster domain
MLTSPCDVPSIACIHCASAKTRCDKRVPCSRCAEKDLQCEARFARRRRSQRPPIRSPSSKAELSPLSGNGLVNIVPQDPHAESATIQPNTPLPQPPQRPVLPQRKTYPLPNLITADHTFGTPDSSSRELDAIMTLDDDLLDGEYQDLMMWNQYSLFTDTNELQNVSGMPPPPMGLNGTSLTSESHSLGYSMSTPGAMSSNTRNGSLETVPSLTTSHTRTTSMASHRDFDQQFDMVDVAVADIQYVMAPEREIAIAAEAAWPVARCNPPIFSGSCPRTAVMHLEALEEHSKHETWTRLAQNIVASEADFNGQVSVVPLNGSTRDRILAITQSFLHRALETHSGRMKGWAKTSSAEGGFNFLVLPPSNVLEYFLRGSIQKLGLYYMLIQEGTLDPNHLLPHSQRSTLLLLLMIAHGAIAEARVLTSGLIEACRISLFHVIEKDVELSADPTILRCALLFIIVGAWSGDAWHMNISMGQRAMYLAVGFHQLLESRHKLTSCRCSSMAACWSHHHRSA